MNADNKNVINLDLKKEQKKLRNALTEIKSKVAEERISLILSLVGGTLRYSIIIGSIPLFFIISSVWRDLEQLGL